MTVKIRYISPPLGHKGKCVFAHFLKTLEDSHLIFWSWSTNQKVKNIDKWEKAFFD